MVWPFFETHLQFFSFLEGENSNEIRTVIQSVEKRPLTCITKSVVWDYFKKLSKEDDKAQCTICSECSQNTTNLFKVCKQHKVQNYNKC